MEVFGMAIFRTTVVIFIIVGVQATKTIATSSTTEPMAEAKGNNRSTHQHPTTPTTNHSSTTLPTTARHNSTGKTTTPGAYSTAHPATPGTNSTTPPSKPGNHSTIPPPKPGNHSTIPPSKSGNHSEPTTQESHSKTPSPKGHGKGAHGDSRGKWVAAGFAVFFAITTIIMTALYCRQRKIYRELEGDSSLSRLI